MEPVIQIASQGRQVAAKEMEVWKSGWAIARIEHTDYVPCFYCDPPQAFDRLHGHLRSAHDKSPDDFRHDFGLNKSSRLVSVRFSEAMAQKRGKALAKSGRRTRFKRGDTANAAAGVAARKLRGVSAEAKRNISEAHKGRAQPKLRNRDSLRRTIPNWIVVELRLRGLKAKETAQAVSAKYDIKISAGAVVRRWRTMELPPGKPCYFDRGEAVTEVRLLEHWKDLQIVRGGKSWLKNAAAKTADADENQLTVKDAADLLAVSTVWVYSRVHAEGMAQIPHVKEGRRLVFRRSALQAWAAKLQHAKSSLRPRGDALAELAWRLKISVHRLREFLIQEGGPYRTITAELSGPRVNRRKANYPLSRELAARLVENCEPLLKQEWQGIGAGASGGAPEAYLPSEKRQIPHEYDGLMADCEKLTRWAKDQDKEISMEQLGEWMCEHHRSIQLIFLWPSLHSKLLDLCEDYRSKKHGEAALSDRVKGWLAKAHGGSVRTIERIITSTRKAVAATA